VEEGVFVKTGFVSFFISSNKAEKALSAVICTSAASVFLCVLHVADGELARGFVRGFFSHTCREGGMGIVGGN